MALNALRFGAALVVVVSHVRPLLYVDFSQALDAGPGPRAIYAVTTLGHQAVIVFFVLSGYWVGGSVLRGLRERRFDVARYATSRAVRLWIVLLPAMVLTQALDRSGTWFFPDSDVYAGSTAYHLVVPQDGALHRLGALTTLGNAVFLQSLAVPQLGTDTPLWSLALEFWYYVIFPAVLLAVWRGVARRVRLVAALVGAVGLAVLWYGHTQGSQGLVLFPTWLVGAGVAWALEPVGRALGRVPAWALGPVRAATVVAVVGVALVHHALGEGFALSLVLALVAGLLVALLTTDVRGVVRRFWNPFSWGAEWSYSLYATHVPVIAFVTAILAPVAAGRRQLTWATLPVGLGVAAVAVLVALAVYAVAERHTGALRAVLLRAVPRPRLFAPVPADAGTRVANHPPRAGFHPLDH
ncbi:acyltransferase family protein [Xylanimonas protaetiae]|uniref:acyltransferase family protein n=1 Tax=Xylanimonas protaetiae TaxID=2509457 RepID=UPI0013ED2D3C|nr:acyltransferase [Xylanimonas protaetiae]